MLYSITLYAVCILNVNHYDIIFRVIVPMASMYFFQSVTIQEIQANKIIVHFINNKLTNTHFLVIFLFEKSSSEE